MSHTAMQKLSAEFLGTFFLMLTIGMTVPPPKRRRADGADCRHADRHNLLRRARRSSSTPPSPLSASSSSRSRW
jgi:hypothetical protein